MEWNVRTKHGAFVEDFDLAESYPTFSRTCERVKKAYFAGGHDDVIVAMRKSADKLISRGARDEIISALALDVEIYLAEQRDEKILTGEVSRDHVSLRGGPVQVADGVKIREILHIPPAETRQ